MESAGVWRQVSLCAGRLAFAASFAPLLAAVGYGVGRTYGAALAPLLPGAALFTVALATLFVAAIAGKRGGAEGLRFLSYAVGSFIGQAMVAVVVGSMWINAQEPAESKRNAAELGRVKSRHGEGAGLDDRPKPRYP